MKKVIEFLKWPLAFPALGVAAIYLFWFLTAPMDYFLSDEIFRNFLFGIVIFCIYLLITIFVKITFDNWKLSLGLLLFLITPTLLCAFLTYTYIYDTIEYHGINSREFIFYSVGTILLIIFPAVIFSKNALEKNKIMRILLATVLFFITSGNLLFLASYYPITEEIAELGEHNYRIVYSRDSDYHGFYTLYQCNRFGFSCVSLYASWNLNWKELIVDELKNEVSLLGTSGLIYTTGENSRVYFGGVGEFNNHIYQLSQQCDNFNDKKGYYSCEIYSYRLYECNLDYKSCNPLLIQYTAEDDVFLIVEGNEETGEIEVYDDYKEDGGNLIFTYGEHPHCYVEGCEILEE